MKGNQQIIDQLNFRLVEELTAINQYENHKAIVLTWGYNKLVDYIQERIDDELKHYRMLHRRIRFLGGLSVVSKINEIKTAGDIVKIHEIDLASEVSAIANYNETIKLCTSLGDNGTRLVLEEILKDEEDHTFDLEAQIIQLKQMSIQNYLSAKI